MVVAVLVALNSIMLIIVITFDLLNGNPPPPSIYEIKEKEFFKWVNWLLKDLFHTINYYFVNLMSNIFSFCLLVIAFDCEFSGNVNPNRFQITLVLWNKKKSFLADGNYLWKADVTQIVERRPTNPRTHGRFEGIFIFAVCCMDPKSKWLRDTEPVLSN